VKRTLEHRLAMIRLAAIFALASWACASSPKASWTGAPDSVKELEIPFPVQAPLTSQDAVQIADSTRPMLRNDEHIHGVDPVPCTSASCLGGVEQRAEALVLSANSDMADIILLCKRSGLWIASRPTDERLGSPDCPDVRGAAQPGVAPDGASLRR
jgi:hypothetical protein